MKTFKILVVLLTSLAFSPAHAALVSWQPTNPDVNYVYTTAPGYSLALFDVEDFDGLQLNPLLLNTNASADSIAITAADVNFTATSLVTANSITLFNDDQFVLAITDGVDWLESLSSFELAPGSNIYNINFAFASVTSFDARPAAVPAPAASWLFGSGLLAFFGLLRSKAWL